MMLKILVLSFLTLHNFVVSGNQLLIPLQTCPQNCNCNTNCNQNYQNPSNMPFTIQIPLQQPVYQQPSNNHLYPQGYMAQNQLAIPQVSGSIQGADPLTNQLNQLYMNMLMSNPTLQTILDPKTLYNPRNMETPRQANNIPNNIPYNINTNKNTPNTGTPVINNYYIVPPEFFDNDILKEIQRLNPDKRERETNRRSNNGDRERRVKSDPDIVPTENRRRQQNNHSPEPNSRREGQRRKVDEAIELDRDAHRRERGRHNTKRRPEERRRNSDQGKDINVPTGHNSNKNRRQHNDRRKTDDCNHERRCDKEKTPKPDPTKTQADNSEKVSLKSSAERSVETTPHTPKRKSKKSRDDAIIEDFHEKFPGIPEDVIRKLLSYMRKQLQKQPSENQPLQYPGFNFPLNFDQLMPQYGIQENRRKSNNNNNSNRKNHTRKSKSKTTSKPRSNVETTTVVESTTAPTTTVSPKVNKPKAQEVNKPSKVQEEKPKEKVTTTTVEPTNVFEDTESTTFMPKSDEENDISDMSNRIFPDYYPDFTKDKMYGSEEVNNVRKFRDDRYYYTTDRNYESRPSMHEYNMRRLKTLHRKLEDSFEEVLPKPNIEDYDTDAEIEYHTPPMLDFPEFTTKQMKRPDHNVKEFEKRLSYKSSTYSDAKDVSNKDGKLRSRKPKADNIETVFAHSKVVKYGKTDDGSEENVTPVVTYYLPDNMQYEEDGKTIIVAKSIPADHFW